MRRNSFHPTDLPPDACRPILRARRLRGRGAFTLLEMMTAVAIILVLMAIAVIAFRALDANASRKETGAIMATLNAMVAELDSVSGLSRLEGASGVFKRGAYIDTPGEVNAGAANADEIRYGERAKQTQLVIAQLRLVPKNKTALAQLSSKRVLGPAPAGVNLQVSHVDRNPDPPIPLDGWRNPIIFVPSGGLNGVQVDGTAVLITSSGLRKKTSDDPVPQDRPFWASAGPDGDFSKGEDNIYSFKKD